VPADQRSHLFDGYRGRVVARPEDLSGLVELLPVRLRALSLSEPGDPVVGAEHVQHAREIEGPTCFGNRILVGALEVGALLVDQGVADRRGCGLRG
jgi:hypothetical protein